MNDGSLISIRIDVPISIEEYANWIRDNVDLSDQESICESANLLFRLSENDSLLSPIISEPLKSMAGVTSALQKQNMYTDTSLMLTDNEYRGFFVRANIWKIPQKIAGTRKYEEKLYLYQQPHDHDFDFLTVGYYGPGYETTIYEYDPDSILGVVGEDVDLKFLERTTLPKGKVMFYRKSIDVHNQEPPSSLSISINLMIEPVSPKQQYSFDLERSKISSYDAGYFRSQMSVIEIAGLIGDDDTKDILMSIGINNSSDRVRLEAYKSLIRLSPKDAAYIMNKAALDKSYLVSSSINSIII